MGVALGYLLCLALSSRRNGERSIGQYFGTMRDLRTSLSADTASLPESVSGHRSDAIGVRLFGAALAGPSALIHAVVCRTLARDYRPRLLARTALVNGVSTIDD